MRQVNREKPAAVVSDISTQHAAKSYLERLPLAIRFWLDPRLMNRVDVDEIAEEVADALTTSSNRWRTDERVGIDSLRGTALMAMERVERDYLGSSAIPFPSLLLRLNELPPADTTHLANLLLGRVPPHSESLMCRLGFQRAFNSLSTHHREILAMRHFEKLSPQEISEVTQLRPRDVANRYRRAVARLKSKLRRQHP